MSSVLTPEETEDLMQKRREISRLYCQPHGCRDCEICNGCNCMGYFREKGGSYEGPITGTPYLKNVETGYRMALELTQAT